MQKSPSLQEKDGVVYINPSGQHKSTVVWLHGLGDSAMGFVPFFSSGMMQGPHVKIVLPTAPVRKVTVNMGFESTSWFDFRSFVVNEENFSESISIDEVADSARIITSLIEQEAKLVGHEKVFLGGFSQGACMSLHVGLEYPKKLGGILALSGFMFPVTKFSEANAKTTVFVAHGEKDPLLMWALVTKSYDRLRATKNERELTFNVEAGVAHEVSQTTLIFLKEYFKSLSS